MQEVFRKSHTKNSNIDQQECLNQQVRLHRWFASPQTVIATVLCKTAVHQVQQCVASSSQVVVSNLIDLGYWRKQTGLPTNASESPPITLLRWTTTMQRAGYMYMVRTRKVLAQGKITNVKYIVYCWPLPSNQSFYGQIASCQRGVGDHHRIGQWWEGVMGQQNSCKT